MSTKHFFYQGSDESQLARKGNSIEPFHWIYALSALASESKGSSSPFLCNFTVSERKGKQGMHN